MAEYIIRRVRERPSLKGRWDEAAWRRAETVSLDYFHPEGREHCPLVRVRALYDDSNIYVLFHVTDRFVRSVRTSYQDMVCNDSCVEFFVQPKGDGYFNFETNCGGTMLLYYILPHPEGFAKATRTEVPESLGSQVQIFHSMPDRVEPEIEEPTKWVVETMIPVSLLEHYVGNVRPLSGQEWRGNFYKCGDETSHPHWAMWSPVRKGFSFHQPRYFGTLRFEAAEGA